MYTFILRFKYILEWFEYVATGRCRWCVQRNGRELLLAFRCDEMSPLCQEETLARWTLVVRERSRLPFLISSGVLHSRLTPGTGAGFDLHL